jgi:hypothetical protein
MTKMPLNRENGACGSPVHTSPKGIIQAQLTGSRRPVSSSLLKRPRRGPLPCAAPSALGALPCRAGGGREPAEPPARTAPPARRGRIATKGPDLPRELLLLTHVKIILSAPLPAPAAEDQDEQHRSRGQADALHAAKSLVTSRPAMSNVPAWAADEKDPHARTPIAAASSSAATAVTRRTTGGMRGAMATQQTVGHGSSWHVARDRQRSPGVCRGKPHHPVTLPSVPSRTIDPNRGRPDLA